MVPIPVLVASKSFGYGAHPDQLNELFRAYSLDPIFFPLEDSLDRIDQFEGIIIGTAKVDRALLSQSRRLRAIVKYGVGIDNVDTTAAKELGIQVRNLPGINAPAVAELAFGLMLAVARKVALGDRLIRSGKWEGLIGSSVCGKTLGIIGAGAIGCSLAKFVTGMDMTVIGYDLFQNPDFVSAGGKFVELDELLVSADFISLHLTLNAQTLHFIDREKLARMKPGAILINTSRGKIVDEAALVEALQNGPLAGAALDVFETEPPSCQPLLVMENVVLTPHIGAYTQETLRRMDETCVATLCEALQSK
jgi:D-3-phosphoglycerate dehydrogenase